MDNDALLAELAQLRGAVADLARRAALLAMDVQDPPDVGEEEPEAPAWCMGGAVTQDAAAWKRANAFWLAPLTPWREDDPLPEPLEPLASIVYDALTRPL